MLYNTETGETFKNPKTYAPGTGSSSSIGLTPDDKRTLLGGGWSEGDISTLESGIREYGLTDVIEKERAAGASDSQISALQKAYGSTEKVVKPSVFDRNYVSTVFNIPDNDDQESSFLGFEWGDTNAEKLNNIMSRIEVWKNVGKTDEEIYKALGGE